MFRYFTNKIIEDKLTMFISPQQYQNTTTYDKNEKTNADTFENNLNHQ